MSQPIVALDIGSTKVACAVGLPREQGEGFELCGTSLVAYGGVGEAWPGDPQEVGRTIEKALKQAGLGNEVHGVHVALSHPQMRSERVRVSVDIADEPIPVRIQDLDRLEQRAVHQVLGIDREALSVDRLGCSGNGFTDVPDPTGLPATRLSGEFHILTIPMALRRSLLQAVESVGLELFDVTYALRAALSGVADSDTIGSKVLLIDIGGRTTDIGLFVCGVLREVRVVPWGGQLLSEGIAEQYHVAMPHAISWSLEGLSSPKPEVRDFIMQQGQSLCEALEGLLRYHPRPDKALVCGRGALIDGLIEWLEQKTGIKTQLSRGMQTRTLQHVSQQSGLHVAMGLLQRATHQPSTTVESFSHPFSRLLAQTRTLLAEYF